MKQGLLTLYFSGTGNTKYVVDALTEHLNNKEIDNRVINIEGFDPIDIHHIENADFILFAYPVYGSMTPMLVWQFVREYGAYFEGKKAAVLATQWMASGDGGAYLARILKKCKMDVVSIEHFNMANNISDVSWLPIKNGNQLDKKRKHVDQKIELFALDLANQRYYKIGSRWYSMVMGAFQRIPFSKMERKLAKDVKIDMKTCSRCQLCVDKCPMKNLSLEADGVAQKGVCTLCYRCVNLCPQQSISIFSKKKPRVQYKGF